MELSPLGKIAARRLLHNAGLLKGIRYWNRNGVRILMYHDFPTRAGLQDALDKQCAHIRQHYEVISLTEIGNRLNSGKAFPKNALAVTVDDGNRDFLVN